jgi:phage terminase small subunit
MTLTIKQEFFCMKYIETGNASEAYRQSYNTKNMKPESINRKAKELVDNGKITAMLQNLRTQHMQRHNITVDTQTAKLEEIYRAAFEEGQYAASVSAVMSQVKLHGLVVDAKVDLKVTNETLANEARESIRRILQLATVGKRNIDEGLA